MNTHKGYTMKAVACPTGWMVWYGKLDSIKNKLRSTRVKATAIEAETEAIDLINLMTRK